MLTPNLPDLSALASKLLATYASPFTQDNRIVTLAFGSGSNIAPNTLIAHRVIGHEAINDSYCISLEALSADMHLELKDLLAQGAAIHIRTAADEDRIITGVITRAQFAGSNGGLTSYILHIEPAFATLNLRINSRNFQDKTVIEIVSTILQEHIDNNPMFGKHFSLDNQTHKSYPRRSYCNQYKETDYAFILRLLAEEGISFTWAFSDDDDAPHHQMMLFDDVYTLEEAMQARIRFHRADGTELEDSITDWQSARQICTVRTSIDTYDYQRASLYGSDEHTSIHQGDQGNAASSTLESYLHQAPYYGADEAEMARYAILRQQANDLRTKFSRGTGTVRTIAAGHYFALTDHPVIDHDRPEDRQFIVHQLDWVAQNNLPNDTKAALATLIPRASLQGLANSTKASNATRKLIDDIDNADQATTAVPPYRCTFHAMRRGIPIVPAYCQTEHAKPTASGTQTATVVGPAGEEIYTDEHGRIKIQFHWQRPTDHPEGNAALDDKSSTWVRVAPHSADGAWGKQHIPRIGSEVLIAFLDNDIDRPICIASIHNGTHMPPTFSNAGNLPANKTLSGTKTKEHKGSGYNQLLFDNSTGQLRVKLSTEHASTQLNMGYLIHPRTEGKGTPRGEGFELRTDAAGTLRAAQGILLCADAQPNANGKQRDRNPLTQQLNAAYELAQNLGEHAQHQQAHLPETGKGNQQINDQSITGKSSEHGHQTHVKDAIQHWERGSNTDKEGKTGKGAQQGSQQGGQSIIAISAPDGIAIATQNSMTIATGTNFDQVAQRDTNQSTGRRWIHNVTESASLFISGSKVKLKDTLKIIAAKGNIKIQAQDGAIDVTAQQSITITSVANNITFQAPKEIMIMAGGGYIRIGASTEVHNPGMLSLKAKDFAWEGAGSMSYPIPKWTKSDHKRPCEQAASEQGSAFVKLK